MPPWNCCGNELADDIDCSECGKSKKAWTLRFNKTRVFHLSKARAANSWLEVELDDADGEPVAGEPYELLRDGDVVRFGNLDDDGVARLKDLTKGSYEVRFPQRDATEFGLEDDAWLDLELSGEDGSPLAAEPYVVTLPGGSERAGELDSNGRAREEGLPSGTCMVRFPQRDAVEVRRSPFEGVSP